MFQNNSITMKILLYVSAFFMAAFLGSCHFTQKTEKMSDNLKSVPGPKAIIYKTTKDYSLYVPITLSDDKKSIESYPDVKDIYYNGELALPTSLSKGYLLDNRGINKNVAFLRITYAEYAAYKTTPTPGELFLLIQDADPLTEMYSAGNRSKYKDIVAELNNKIDKNDFSDFVRVK